MIQESIRAGTPAAGWCCRRGACSHGFVLTLVLTGRAKVPIPPTSVRLAQRSYKIPRATVWWAGDRPDEAQLGSTASCAEAHNPPPRGLS